MAKKNSPEPILSRPLLETKTIIPITYTLIDKPIIVTRLGESSGSELRRSTDEDAIHHYNEVINFYDNNDKGRDAASEIKSKLFELLANSPRYKHVLKYAPTESLIVSNGTGESAKGKIFDPNKSKDTAISLDNMTCFLSLQIGDGLSYIKAEPENLANPLFRVLTNNVVISIDKSDFVYLKPRDTDINNEHSDFIFRQVVSAKQHTEEIEVSPIEKAQDKCFSKQSKKKSISAQDNIFPTSHIGMIPLVALQQNEVLGILKKHNAPESVTRIG